MRIRSSKNWLWMLCVLVALGLAFAQKKDEGPQPRPVDAGRPGQPPSDAVVLFGGQDGAHSGQNPMDPATLGR